MLQTHENEEDGASDNKDEDRRDKDKDIAVSFVFGQNIKDRAKVGIYYFAPFDNLVRVPV